MLLLLYRLASAGVQPILPTLLRWRSSRGKEDRYRLRERMGFPGLSRPAGRLVWIHAASVGDGQTLLPLIGRLGARGFHVLLSTRTVVSANALKRQMPAGSFHQFMPIDAPSYIKRFLAHWQPDMILLAGAELWPNVLAAASRRGTPVIFVNGRITDTGGGADPAIRRRRRAPPNPSATPRRPSSGCAAGPRGRCARSSRMSRRCCRSADDGRTERSAERHGTEMRVNPRILGHGFLERLE